jgi:hypothetical protein
MRYGRLFLISVIIILFTSTLLRAFRRESCKYLVVLNSKERIKAKRLNWYKSGFVDIRKCDGSYTTCGENYIDTIIIKK